MHIFLSAGEPSGDLHASHLALALQNQEPTVRLSGLGGKRLAATNCEVLFPLADHAIMGIWPAIRNLPFFVRILKLVDDWLRRQRPDLVILIDNPGFNWHVARLARKQSIPVWYYIPPQLWAWGAWRIRKMRRLVHRVLSGLPFEAAWYRRRGIRAEYIGHPYCDALQAQSQDVCFLEHQRERGGIVVGLLPGSRQHEVSQNFPTLLRLADILAQHRPDLRFLVACYQEQHVRWIADYVSGAGHLRFPFEIHVGRTAEIIQLARVCAAVSGSVTLELLYHARPSVVLYRISPLARCLKPLLLKCRYITLVNLLADQEIFPEFVTVTCPADQLAHSLLTWINDASAWQRCHDQLLQLRQQFFQPGASARAAAMILSYLSTRAQAA
ncbi:MAG: lipid-A-disaccharide synthase [Gemmatales bacterium]|nr:lipid-A-disaccharide synthase [Gemmatales bacterium]